jgi:hypothetical protein
MSDQEGRESSGSAEARGGQLEGEHHCLKHVSKTPDASQAFEDDDEVAFTVFPSSRPGGKQRFIKEGSIDVTQGP